MSMVRIDRAQKQPSRPPTRARGGLRERNKEAKLRRIERAGRALFTRRGFDETTTREIARKAGVAAGTFFLYFPEKRDLLLHLFRTDVEAVQQEALESLPAGAPLTAQLGHLLGRFQSYYAEAPSLSRVFMKELMFVEPGRRDDMMALTMSFVGRIADLIDAAQRRG